VQCPLGVSFQVYTTLNGCDASMSD
jgi:hypothetical protein